MSVMLGLISVMCLTSLALAMQKRDKEIESIPVKLVSIPIGFRPLQIKCLKNSFEWQQTNGNWNTIHFKDKDVSMGMQSRPQEMKRFMNFIINKILKNRQLSHLGQQHTIIMWVEPDGIMTYLTLSYKINALNLPVRIGALPILEGEEILQVKK
ncbi:MAG: hypothetical protein HRT89_20770 [Lentisphaeria bacterium]|nr:hypothetical protein [Lentisphaeria bacterium]NQZ70493.1 hypothetical protein [Lentisphaeria bacterium]